MKKNLRYIVAISVAVSLFSCVPQRKLEEEEAKRKTCETELEALKTSCRDCDTKLTEAAKTLADDQKIMNGLQKDTSILGTSYRSLTSKYDKLNQINEQLLDKYNRLLEGNLADTKKLSGELQMTQEQLLKKQDELRLLEAQLNAQKKNLDELTAELKKREARVKELEDILKRKDEASNELKKKLSDALLGFEGKGLTITQKNGKVYVSMDESLLFASGSTTVEAKGVEALKKVAKVLEQNTDINVLIEGHTDDVPMAGKGEIKDNWDLSVVRATSIVKIITKNSTVDPRRLTAAGRGEYFPIESAKTVEARKKNRRTEIILTPKLDELLKVLEAN
ncbi:MAG: OmpA family protein [Bacteroidota bacterium]|nr:OmpA family protein [Bacteroidota bacterium]